MGDWFTQVLSKLFGQRLGQRYGQGLGRRLSQRLGQALGQGLDCLYVADLGPMLPPVPEGTPQVSLGSLGEVTAMDSQTPIFSETTGQSLDRPLIVYVHVGFLSARKRIIEDIGCLLKTRQKIILVLIQDNYLVVPFDGHSYILSILASCASQLKVKMSIDVYVAPPPNDTIISVYISVLRSLIMEQLERIFGQAPQSGFSSLVVSISRPTPPSLFGAA